MYLVVEYSPNMGRIQGIAHGCALTLANAKRLQLSLGVRAYTKIIYC